MDRMWCVFGLEFDHELDGFLLFWRATYDMYVLEKARGSGCYVENSGSIS